MTTQPREAGYFKQLGAGFIDAVLVLAVTIAILMNQVFNELLAGMNSTLLAVIIFAIYRACSIFVFKQTIGMKLFGVILLNDEFRPLSFVQKLLASVFVLYRGTEYYEERSLHS